MDDDEFAREAGRHLPRMTSAARRILRDADLAADAVQEALVALWRHDVRPEDPGAWLQRAVTLRSLDLARRRRRLRDHEERARLGRPERSSRDDPAAGLERRDLALSVREALARLRPDHREILALRDVEGLGYEEVAEALGVPVGTVRSRLHRARAALGAELLRRLPELRPGERD
ncbi:sigma-70 family RNA polymerase sigma factor [Paludisphaera sp.]|uniref:RNA polymerase sigma factor n=1 Tax=Paludisphaera sp. TaxID=2017432 RepID=UPI00301DA6B6